MNSMLSSKKNSFAGFLAAALLVLPGGAWSQSSKPSLTDLAWLSGCWEMTVMEKDLRINEQWMKPAGGMMIGSGRTVKAGKTVDYEFVRIVDETDAIYYIAKPTANKEETRFKLIKSSASEVIFENPTHDFPQRVIYRLDGQKLNARIEGINNGKTSGVDFPYTRAKCE
jgi:hypothetical protein